MFFFTHFLKIFALSVQFLAFLQIFTWFWTFFAHILCAKFSGSKICKCYFLSFFPLWPLLHFLLLLIYISNCKSANCPNNFHHNWKNCRPMGCSLLLQQGGPPSQVLCFIGGKLFFGGEISGRKKFTVRK